MPKIAMTLVVEFEETADGTAQAKVLRLGTPGKQLYEFNTAMPVPRAFVRDLVEAVAEKNRASTTPLPDPVPQQTVEQPR